MEKVKIILLGILTFIQLLIMFLAVLALSILHWICMFPVRWIFGKQSEEYRVYMNFLNIEE